MTDLYNVNDTMKMIGNTPIQMMGDTKEFEEVKNIMKAFSEYGDDFEKVFSKFILETGFYHIFSDVFTLGYIYGIRKERNKRKKK